MKWFIYNVWQGQYWRKNNSPSPLLLLPRYVVADPATSDICVQTERKKGSTFIIGIINHCIYTSNFQFPTHRILYRIRHVKKLCSIDLGIDSVQKLLPFEPYTFQDLQQSLCSTFRLKLMTIDIHTTSFILIDVKLNVFKFIHRYHRRTY